MSPPGGYYLMHRGWMDNPALGGSREPFCRRAAWTWLIENACYQTRDIDIGGRTLTLQRGQLAHSYRYMAEAWSWSLNGVQRFIERLKTDTMINTDSSTGRLVITLCNYEVYQSKAADDNTETGTAVSTLSVRGQYAGSTNTKEGKEGNEVSTSAPEGVGELFPTAAKSLRGKRLPDDMTLPDEWRRWCLQRRPDLDPDVVWLDFHNYWTQRVGRATSLNWFKTWQNRVMQMRAPPRVNGNGHAPAVKPERRPLSAPSVGTAAEIEQNKRMGIS